ncbi:hypothetical protein QTO34_018183 [Cnephaeus nilssonii]|uniref:Uncharacterized protein n=1 Tax=Cnephaeus nilssonii TaxID=3371016 RepID=A0AA40LQ57_CNENI|nr:hypothetical protein QTO34_018183 [Eptesicus nilssonii]
MRPWVRVKLNPGSGRGRVPLDPVSSCELLQVAQDQTREGRTCIATIRPPSRTEISLLTSEQRRPDPLRNAVPVPVPRSRDSP